MIKNGHIILYVGCSRFPEFSLVSKIDTIGVFEKLFKTSFETPFFQEMWRKKKKTINVDL